MSDEVRGLVAVLDAPNAVALWFRGRQAQRAGCILPGRDHVMGFSYCAVVEMVGTFVFTMYVVIVNVRVSLMATLHHYRYQVCKFCSLHGPCFFLV